MLSKRTDIDESSGQKLYLKRMFKEYRYAYAISNKNTVAVPIQEEWQIYPCRKGDTIEQEMSQKRDECPPPPPPPPGIGRA